MGGLQPKVGALTFGRSSMVFKSLVTSPPAPSWPLSTCELRTRGGIVEISRCVVVDATGRTVMRVHTKRGQVVADLIGEWPATLACASIGRSPGEISNIFLADPRSALAPVVQARLVSRGRRAFLRLTFADVLVPLDPACGGGEDWRPTEARGRPSVAPYSAEHVRQLYRAATVPPFSPIPELDSARLREFMLAFGHRSNELMALTCGAWANQSI